MLKNFFKNYDKNFLLNAQKSIKYNKKIEKENDLYNYKYSIITLEKARGLGYILSEDSRFLINENNVLNKIEGIYIKDKKAVEIFDKEFGSNINLITKITNKNYFFILKKHFKKTFENQAFTVAYNKKDLVVETTYFNEKNEIHRDNDKPALLLTDMKSEMDFKLGYFQNGKLHRENNKPAVEEYEKGTKNLISLEFCKNGELHTDNIKNPSQIVYNNGFEKIYWHKNGRINSIKDNPALIYKKKAEETFFDKDYDGFWIKDLIEDNEAIEIHIYYNEGRIDRNNDKPAIYIIDKNKKIIKEYYFKNHKLHRDNLKPAYIDYKNNRGSFFINGKDVSEEVIKWSKDNNIDLGNLKNNDIIKWKNKLKKMI